MNHPDRTGWSAEGEAVSALILTVFRTNGRLIRAGDAMVRDLGLTSARWQILSAIEGAPKTVAQIAREFELTRQGVLWVVRSMIPDGLIELIDNPDHRRAKLVRQTSNGARAYDEVMRRQHIWANRIGREFDLRSLEGAVATADRLCREVLNDAVDTADD